MPDQNRQYKVIVPQDDLDHIAQHTCKTVYRNCKHIDLRSLTDQTAKYISKRHDVDIADANRAATKWMIIEATIDEAYSPRQRERLRASHWMQQQLEIHDAYLQEVARRLK
jgi:alpha-N-acetylglucosamine transferase